MGDSMQVAEDSNAEQYAAAEEANLCSTQWKSKIHCVDTLPFVCGVRGSVQYKTL